MNNVSEAEIKEVTRKHRALKFLPPDKLKGQVDLVIKGEFYHQFDLEIQIGNPFSFPIVWETKGDIPRVVERHVFPETGNLCFGVIAEERLVCCNGITLSWFFDNILLPRLADEYCVIHGGDYSKERSHGTLGDWEFYLKELNTNSRAFVLTMLILLKLKIPPKSYDLCPCRSGDSFTNCHEKSLARIIDGSKRISIDFWNHEIQKLKINGTGYIL